MAKKKQYVPVGYRPFLDHVTAVDWGALETLVSEAPATMSMSERAEFTVRALNGEACTAQEWNQFVGVSIVRNASKPLALPPELRDEFAFILGKVFAGRERERDTALELRDWSATDALISWIASTNVILVPVVPKSSDPRKSGDYRVIARSIPEALMFVLWLFLDPARHFGSTTLHRCQYSGCRRYYLLTPKGRGRPPTTYCSKPCRDAGDTERAPIRMRKTRRRRK